MEEIHQLLKGFFGFILPGHIGKSLAGLGFHIDLGVALAKGHGVARTHFFCDHAEHECAQQRHQGKRHHKAEHHGYRSGQLFLNDAAELDAAAEQPVCQLGIAHIGGDIDVGVIFVAGLDGDFILGQLYHGHFAFVQHFHKIAVVDLNGIAAEQKVHHDHNQQKPHIVKNQGTPQALGAFRLFSVLGSGIHRFTLLGQVRA